MILAHAQLSVESVDELEKRALWMRCCELEAQDYLMRRLPSLTSLRSFEAAARLMSFTLAADELCVTQGAISRQVKALEEYLATPLFLRGARSLELTPTGSAYYQSLRQALDLMEQATQRAVGDSGDHILTLSVLPTFAAVWLMPRLHSFNVRFPRIELRIITSILPVDFRGDVDVAIRVGSVPDEVVSAERARLELRMTDDWTGIAAEYLFSDRLTVVCSPAVAAGPPKLQQPSDLKDATLLHTSTRPHAWHDWLAITGTTDVDPNKGPAFGHFFMTLQAAAEGKGLACAPSILVADDLRTGRLVKPFDITVNSAGDYHLIYRRHQCTLPKIAAFRNWLAEEVSTFSYP